jgi:non-specific serine/threonine protein kinase/serine/threonine-protein kinase
MTPEAWARVKTILGEALDLAPAQRPAYLETACAGDGVLRTEVESLLTAGSEEWGFFDTPPEVRLPEPDALLPPSRVGERIGAYELVSELGRGGMGMVYLARRADDQFQKKVAIKLIRPGMASELSLGRFRSERQISASLEHPHIARLLDGGTTPNGEPYFVLEYVEGEPLIEYCDRRRLPIDARLRLFGEVCAAVQYAHQNLVVHRDIKPSNVLVTADGVPKLLDFGIAKLLNPDGAPVPADETGTLFRMLTPDYASPEQIRGERITTASDIYALGVVLYELLAGRKPYHVTGSEPGELMRVVCDRDPEKPSVAAKSRELEGDLDAIVLKAMRKEPERRYASVGELSADLKRHQTGVPVLARRGTFSYRAGKFARRHRVILAAAALVAIALAGGVVATLREAQRARAAEARAQRRFDDVRKLASSFLFEFHDAIQDLPGATPARALIVKRALEYLDDLSRESAGDRELRRELAEAYLKVGDVQGNGYMPNLGDVPGAIQSYGKAIALLAPVVEAGKADDAEQSTLAKAYLTGGGIQLVTGDSHAAVAMAEKGLPLVRGLAERHPGDAERQRELAQAWQFYSFYLTAAGRYGEAYEALRNQAAILRARLAEDPGDRAARRSLGQNLYLMGEALDSRGDPEGALKSYQEAVNLEEALRVQDPAGMQLQRDLGYLRWAIGGYYEGRGDHRAAVDQYQRALALFESMAAADAKSVDGRLGVAMSRHNIGQARAGLGDSAGALAEFERARVLYEPIVAGDPGNAWAAGALADLYLEIGKVKEKAANPDAACSLYARADDIYVRLTKAGRLASLRSSGAAEAAAAVARCRGGSGEPVADKR